MRGTKDVTALGTATLFLPCSTPPFRLPPCPAAATAVYASASPPCACRHLTSPPYADSLPWASCCEFLLFTSPLHPLFAGV